MKKKILMMCFMALVCLSARVSAANFAVPVYFHTTSTQNIPALFQAICDLNNNYRNANFANPIPVTFYVAGYRTNLTVGSQLQSGCVNVYLNQSPDAYVAQFDCIKLQGLSSFILTHEMGHWLGLLHPEVGTPGTVGCGNSSCSGMGDPDCCSDTPPGFSNNWMNQGGGAILTNCQRSKIIACLTARGIPTTGDLAALHLSHYYDLPLEKLTTGGVLTFDYANCNELPASVTLFIRTQCPAGSSQAYLTQTVTNIFAPFAVNIVRGIQSIQYIYNYNSTTLKNKRTRFYSIPKSPDYSCPPPPLGPPVGGRMSAIDPNVSDENIFSLDDLAPSISISVADGLNYKNSDYATAYIYDHAGRIISQTKLDEGTGKIDIADLPTGLYIFKALKANGEPAVLRFTK
jgi:hypothetical protein